MEEKRIDYTKLSQDRVLSIRELIFECIRKWWIIAICGIVFAVLMGGFKYYRDSQKANANLPSVKPETVNLEELKESLSEEEYQAAENVLHIQENLNNQSDYLDNSLLLEINPYCESIVTLQYFIESDYVTDYTGTNPVDYTGDLLMAYESYVNNGGIGTDLQKECSLDLEARFITELVYCNNAKSKTTNNTGSITNRGFNEAANSLLIKVIAPNKEMCEVLASGIKECIQEYGQGIKQSVGSHTLKLVGEGYNEVVDTDLLTYKTDRANNMQSMLERVESLKEDMSDKQLSYINGMLQVESEEIEGKESDTAASEIHISKKYVVVGAFGGIVLAALAIVFIYLIKGTVNSAEDIQYLYNIKILGKLGKKKPFSSMSSDQVKQLQLLMVNLRMTLDMGQQKRIFVAGSCLDQLDSELVAKIHQEAEKYKLRLEFGDNYLYQPESLEQMLECDGVILLEKERVSKYTDIVNEYKICCEYQKELLGMVMFV